MDPVEGHVRGPAPDALEGGLRAAVEAQGHLVLFMVVFYKLI